jgi:hypothetical protein
LSSKIGNAQSATKSSRITTTSFRTTGTPRVWEGRGETTTQTMFEQRIGGATVKKDRLGLATAAADDFQELDLPDGSNRTTLQSGRVAPS